MIIEEREVWFDETWSACPVLDRQKMKAGFSFVGPAIIEEAGGTSIVPPNWKVTVLDAGSLDCRNPKISS